MTDTLPDAVHHRILTLSRSGTAFADSGDLLPAEQAWGQALDLLPAPATDWEAYTWLWGSIGDIRYLADDLPAAIDAFFNALNGAGGIENPFLHYMLGKALVRFGDTPRGVDELLRAYMLDGDDIFDADEEEGTTMRAIMRHSGVRLPENHSAN